MNVNPNLLLQQVFEIFFGDAKFLPLRALYQGTFAPLDLTYCQQITVNLPLSAGGFTELLLTDGDVEISGPANLGSFGVNISSAVSPTLQQGTFQDIFAVFIITNGENINVTAGLTEGTVYCITSLGSTNESQWQALGFPTGQTPAVGSLFTAANDTPGSGTGIVQTLAINSPFTVPFRKCFSVFE